MKPWFAAALERNWYAPRPQRWLMPFAGLYGLVVRLRRFAYRRGWLESRHAGVPVLVVGNITVGGTGKTPLTLELIARLQARGRRVGVVSRGYGGHAKTYPLAVTANTPAREAGDEPVLLARRSTAAVAVDPRRARAALWLVQEAQVNIVIADDGLQHYALARDAEIAVTSGRRGMGNGVLLPGGPLRESAQRLAAVDLHLVQGSGRDFWLVPGRIYRLDGHAGDKTLADFAGTTVHAVAGIGDPARFFGMLRAYDLDVIEHPMPDHHFYTAADLDFGDTRVVLLTEKDAVKCPDLARPQHWVVAADLACAPACERRIDALLDRLCGIPEAQPAIQA